MNPHIVTLGTGPSDEFNGCRDQFAKVLTRTWDIWADKLVQPRYQIARHIDGTAHLVQAFRDFGITFAQRLQLFEVPQDEADMVVEVMRDASCDLSHGLALVGALQILAQLGLDVLAAKPPLLVLGHIKTDTRKNADRPIGIPPAHAGKNLHPAPLPRCELTPKRDS
ncbi:hypothetical protein [Roseicyclus mahoneyensis]|uniref:hypothetical protein n=1 Tax=Roseicyclus mahoneyensis TaxID=164332 RepID=UPI0014741620|nr:hypothetical protein [Roseicyclus mahoneyensis]